jgi:hypothetical protein
MAGRTPTRAKVPAGFSPSSVILILKHAKSSHLTLPSLLRVSSLGHGVGCWAKMNNDRFDRYAVALLFLILGLMVLLLYLPIVLTLLGFYG